jgi:hypothetical protein
VRVVDEAEQWAFRRRLRQQAQHRHTDEETIRGGRGAQAEEGGERLALRLRETLAQVEQRRTELVKGGEGELDLRLDAERPHDPQIRRRLDGVVEERGLPDPRLAAEHQRRAVAGAHRRQQSIEDLALPLPSDQHWSASQG